MDDPASPRHGQGAKDNAAAEHQRELDACLSTAMTLHQQGHFDEAKKLYLTLLNIVPDHFDATRLLGVMADQLGQYDIACNLLARATQRQPDHVDALYHHALALQHAECPAEAADLYARALTLEPASAQIAENMAVALVDAGNERAAIDVCHRALDLDATSAIAHSNLGKLYFNRGDTAPARHHFEQLLALRPALGEAREKLATVRLREGDFARGWPLYEWRFANEESLRASPPHHGAYPSWSGEDLAGRTILVTREQGVGDEVMFASCLNDLIALAQHVVVQCDDRLQPLFARSFSAATIVGQSAPPADLQIDCCVTLASLPRFLRPCADRFDGRPFLIPDPQRVAKWRAQFVASADALNIGLSWRAGRHARVQQARSIDLSHWSAVFADLNAQVVNLQYGNHRVELDACASAGQLTPLSMAGIDPLQELEDFAALIMALDLVITVDNSTAHLAAALGVPTWVLLPAGAEWRWGENAESALWYGSARLFRQSAGNPGEWQPPLTAVTRALREFEPVQRAAVAHSERQRNLTRREPPSGTHAVLLNDTRNWYHFGCTGTSLALHHQLRKRYRDVIGVPINDTMDLTGVPDTLAGFKDAQIAAAFCVAHAPLLARLERAEHVFINGEGTLHDRSPAACGLLYLAWLCATRLGKAVNIINHSAYPGDREGETLYREVYHSMASIGVREPASARVLRALGLNVIDTFDSLPIYIDELYQPGPRRRGDYAVLAGGVTWHEGAAPAVHQLIKRLRAAGLEVVVLLGARAYPASEELRFAEAVVREHSANVSLECALTERDWLDTIAGAKLLVSGRFHHSIAAAFLGTPLVASGSNTPKMTGLMEACRLPAPLGAPTDWSNSDAQHFARALCERADQALSDPAALRLSPAVRRELVNAAQRNFGCCAPFPAALHQGVANQRS